MCPEGFRSSKVIWLDQLGSAFRSLHTVELLSVVPYLNAFDLVTEKEILLTVSAINHCSYFYCFSGKHITSFTVFAATCICFAINRGQLRSYIQPVMS